MKKEELFSIQEEPNVIDDHLLDIIGNEFKFSHEKGLSEWLKNSADAYFRQDTPEADQYIVFRFTDAAGKKKATFECVDFVGMTKEDIDKAFKRWGDPDAARRGKKQRMYGGHGNGGKFYMRQMFESSYFITYRDGKLNVFGFNERRKYGYAKDYKERAFSPQDALTFAGLGKPALSDEVREKIMKGAFGFTVVRGVSPERMKRKIRMDALLQKLKHHPQARQVLKHLHASCIYNDETVYAKIEPEVIPPMKDFEDPWFMEIPSKVPLTEAGETVEVELANKKFPEGHIVLHTSAESFGTGRLSDLNRVEIIGGFGVIASYHMRSLPYLKHPELADFIYGECKCPILEDADDDCVKNDRTTLQEDNPKTKALLQWICQQIDALADLMHEEQAKHKRKEGNKLSSEYNKVLNAWKNKMMPKFMLDWTGGRGAGSGTGVGTGGELGTGTLGDPEAGSGEGGGGGGGGTGEGSDGGSDGTGGGRGSGEGGTGERGEEEGEKPSGKKGSEGHVEGEGGGEEKMRAQRFRMVLLSSLEADPLSPDGKTLDLLPQQLAVYQRPQDIDRGIYWINTSRPLAEAIINKGEPEKIRH